MVRRLILMALIAANVIIADGQTVPLVQSASSANFHYDVATIKQVRLDGNHFDMMIMNPLREGPFQATNITLRRLLNLAYDRHGNEIEGGPAWIDSNLYDVNARADSSVYEQLKTMSDQDVVFARQKMLQALLVDRCKLSMRTELRADTVFALIEDKGGSWLNKVGDSTSDESAQLKMSVQVLNDKVVFIHAPIRLLLDVLSQETHHKISDHTGLSGLYDFTLTFQRENSIAQRDESLAPTLDKALASQLGLKIQASKGEAQKIVIESMSRPLPF